ncbi:MAG: hypothetical protein LBU61_01080 [Coriobacteriales bacterium]|jgi:hypothetical protein|nr:hypothetical protein [Coriobacteriales bacterium]
MPITERENLLRLFNGELPDWVPIMEDAVTMAMPTPIGSWGFGDFKVGDVIPDTLGVPHVVSDPLVGPMPIPGEPYVPDITRWREFIELPLPDPDSMDWSLDIQLETELDRVNKVVQSYTGGTMAGSPFNVMVKYLSHEGALTALLAEPEAWHDMLSVFIDWEVKVVKKTISIYHPDIMMNADDLSFVHAPFMALETWREMIKPYQKRLFDAISEEGVIVLVHCCGKGEQFVDDWYEMGARCWDPAQNMNDLEAIKARYNNRFVICGGFDSQGKTNKRGTPEAEVRANVRAQIDRLAPGGGFIFSTSMMALPHDIGEEHYNWIYDEARTYGRDFYR